jgi:hypothetical protein
MTCLCLIPSLPRSIGARIDASPTQVEVRADRVKFGSPGAWGNLEYEEIPLENSAKLVVDDPGRLGTPRWVFEGYSKSQLMNLFTACELTSSQRAFLLDANRWETLTNGYAISPSNELVLSLGSAARQRLYPLLARSALNPSQNHPFRCSLDRFDDRFAGSGLPPAKLKWIRDLTYTNDGYLCLSVDKPFVEKFSTNEFQSLVRSFYAISTLRIWLRVKPSCDLDRLLNYWNKGGRAKALRPFLEAIARGNDGGVINVSSFLPTFAASRLYTYPDPAIDPEASKEDCFYTSLNFFKAMPDPRFLDMQNVRTALLSDYSRVNGDCAFGDLVVLLDSKNNGVHACVYIADDIVYTKNGMDILQPWVLMKMSDMLALYPSEPPFQVVKLRQKAQ